MPRLSKLGMAIMLLTLPASAQRIFGWCEQGGARAVVNGNQSQNKVQASYPACTVTVFNGSTVVPATIFSDAGLTTPLANPFTATSTGFWAFYAAPATYDVKFSGTGITTPFTISGYTNSSGGGGGGGGGSVGPGAVNNLSKFTSTTNVGNATCTDDGVTPMACGLGVNLSTSALFTVKVNNGSTGTLANHLVARDASGNAIQAQPTDTNNVIGVAGFGAGTTGSVSIAYSGQFPCIFSNQTAIGDWVIKDPSSSRCLDAGASEPAGIENLGRINSINTGVGTLAGVDWGLPDSTNTSAGGGTGVVGNCNNIGALAYYPATGNTVGCPNGVTVDGSGNITGPSFVGSGTGAGFVAFQQGTAPALGTSNANYLYADTTVTTTFGTALPSVPGTLNQVLAITSVPDASHIKLGFINGPAAAFNAITSGTNNIAAMVVGTGASLTASGTGTIVATSCPTCAATTPGGSNTQVQFNNSGVFGGNAALTFNSGTGTAFSNYLATKNGPRIDPVAWGAANDGTTDDTVPFQNALNYALANHGIVICNGSYKLDRVALSSNSWIEGVGNNNERGCTITVKTDAAFVTATPASFIGSVTIRNMRFLGGSNPIDLGLINYSDFEFLTFNNYTGCGMVLVSGEQRRLIKINSTHNSANGTAVLCMGDKTKSLFSGSIPGTSFGQDRMTIEDVVEQGNITGGVGNYAQYLMIAAGGGIGDSNISGLTCFFSCTNGVLLFGPNLGQDVIFNTRIHGIDLDHVGLSAGSPASIAVDIEGSIDQSSIDGYDPDHNTNFITTQMFVDSCSWSTLSDMKFSSTVDNTTTFGLVFGNHGGNICQLTASNGGLFTASGNNFKNFLGMSENTMHPTNFNAGAQLVDQFNTGAQIVLGNNTTGNNNPAATSLFRVKRGVGDGSTWTDDLTSSGTVLTVNESITAQAGHFSTLDATSGITSISDGVHAGIDALIGNTTAPSIPSNSFGFIGPASASFTSWVIQPSSTAPSAPCNPQLSAVSGNISQMTCSNTSLVIAPNGNKPPLYSQYSNSGTPDLPMATFAANNATLTGQNYPAPDGTNNAMTLVEDSSNNEHYGLATITTSVAIGQTYTWSAYEKRVVGTRNGAIQLSSSGFGIDVSGIVDLGTCNVLTGPNVLNNTYVAVFSSTPVGNGWCLLSATITYQLPDTSLHIDFSTASGTTKSYTGDGTSEMAIWSPLLMSSGGSYGMSIGSHLLISPTAPTITTHFNTSGDSISANNGPSAFTVTVGTSTGTSTGVLGLPTATTGWNCFAANMNRGAYIQQTASGTTSATLTNYGTTVGTPVNWTNSDVLHVSCFAY